MKKSFKSVLSVFLVFTMLFGIAAAITTASAAEESFTEGVFTYTVADGKATITGGDKNAVPNDLVFPAKIGGYPVVAIGDYSFGFCESITSISFEEGSQVETIGESPFTNCYQICKVEIPSSVVTIGSRAFDGKSRLTEVTFGENSKLKVIGNSAFSGTAITEINIPESVETLGNFALNTSTLKEVFIPENVKTIGVSALQKTAFIEVDEKNQHYSNDEYGVLFNKDKTILFQYPTSREGISYEIPASVKEIGSYAFQYSKLEEITFAAGSRLETLDECAFYMTGNIEKITLPEGVKTIGNSAFMYCSNLKNIVLPDSVKTIGNSAFLAGNKLVHVHIPSGTEEIGISVIDGYHAFICSDSEESYAKAYAEENGFTFVLCENDHSEHTVTYKLEGGKLGDSTEDYTVEYFVNQELEYQPVQRFGHNFVGWVDENGNFVEDGTRMPAKDIVLCAKWDAAEYTVDFIIGSEKISRTQIYGTAPDVPEFTVPDGYVFIGWVDLQGVYVEITDDMWTNTLTAVFKKYSKAEGADAIALYDDSAFDREVKLVVEDLTEKDGASGNAEVISYERTLSGDLAKQIGCYDIKMVDLQGNPVNPAEGTVIVKLRIPEGYSDKTDFMIYHWYAEGEKAIFSTEGLNWPISREGDYLVFEVGSFSEFEIYAVSEMEISNAPKNVTYKGTLDLSGTELRIPKKDGTYEVVTDTSRMNVIGFDSTKIGEQTVVIECDGYLAEIKVTVSYVWWQWIIRILLLGFLWY